MDPERGDRWTVPRKEACLVYRIHQLGWFHACNLGSGIEPNDWLNALLSFS